MNCSSCNYRFEGKEQCVRTVCLHLYCVDCAQTISASDDANCRVCDTPITSTNAKVVTILKGANECKLVLWGETPETALSSAMHSVNFFMQEQEQQHSTAQAALTRKIERVHEQCKQKLQQVHNGYVTAKRKYHEVVEAKAVLEAENAELQQKYTQKSGQTRKLTEMFKKLQAENEALRSSRGGGGGIGRGGLSPHISGDGQQTVTTVRHMQVLGRMPANFNPADALTHPHMPGSGGLGRAGDTGGGYGMLMQNDATNGRATSNLSAGGIGGILNNGMNLGMGLGMMSPLVAPPPQRRKPNPGVFQSADAATPQMLQQAGPQAGMRQAQRMQAPALHVRQSFGQGNAQQGGHYNTGNWPN